MSFLSTIRTQLKSKLAAVVTAENLKGYYDHEPQNVTNFPYAALRYNNVRSDIHDTASNLRVVEFVVRVYVKAANPSQSETDLVTAVESVINEIESDPTLGDNVLRTQATSAPMDRETREQEVHYCDITIESQLRVNR